MDDSSMEKKAIVALRNVSLGWRPEKPLVKCESLSIQPGQHVVIRGGVGCGKTLFLHSLLGEVKPIEGTIQVDARLVAYCSQAPWLENLTARQNIFRFSAASDNIWQQRVIDSCALKEFIDSQPDGETIGSGGARLSGGERQRLVSSEHYLHPQSLQPIEKLDTDNDFLNQGFGSCNRVKSATGSPRRRFQCNGLGDQKTHSVPSVWVNRYCAVFWCHGDPNYQRP